MPTPRETVTKELRNIAAEAGQLEHAASRPAQCIEGFVREHAQHLRQAADRAEEACITLIRESEE